MNKNSIVKQIYLCLFRDNRKIPDILNFKENGDLSNSKLEISIKNSNYHSQQYKKHKPFNPIIFPPNYIDIEKVRMFMFRHYIGKVDWNKIFFGDE